MTERGRKIMETKRQRAERNRVRLAALAKPGAVALENHLELSKEIQALQADRPGIVVTATTRWG